MEKLRRIVNLLRKRLSYLQCSPEFGSAFMSLGHVLYAKKQECVKFCRNLGGYRLPKGKDGNRRYNRTGKRESKKS